MPANIFKKTGKVNELFSDERILYPEFIPERLPHRDPEIESMVFAFKPVASGKKPSNVVLLGPSGTGKTVCAKFVVNQLEEFTGRAKKIYVNCFEFNTRSSVLIKIVNALGVPLPRRGLAGDETFSRLLECLKKSNAVPIVVLDEVDQLLRNADGSGVLYDLLRMSEFQENRVGLIIISNDFSLAARLDPRVKSSLVEEKILFEPYTVKQLKDILNERAENAFFPGALEKESLDLAAAHAAKTGGDARIAIELLLKAGRLAEKENAETVSSLHVKKAMGRLSDTPAKKSVPFLGEMEKKILKLLLEGGEFSTGELHRLYSQKSGKKVSLRHFSSALSGLSSRGLIEAEKVVEGMKGKTRKISLKAGKETVQEALRGK